MEPIEALFQKNLNHHAYILTGPSQVIWFWFKKYLENSHADLIGQNPDIYFKSFDTFGITDSRYLRQRGQQKSFTGQRKFFVLQIEFMTREAQNALLKIFEEPPANNVFFLIARTETIFLPTLRSRCQIISCSNNLTKIKDHNSVSAQEFLDQGVAGRLEFINQLAVKKESFKKEALSFLADLEFILYHNKKDNNKELAKIITARRLLLQTTSWPRIILEDIALSLN